MITGKGSFLRIRLEPCFGDIESASSGLGKRLYMIYQGFSVSTKLPPTPPSVVCQKSCNVLPQDFSGQRLGDGVGYRYPVAVLLVSPVLS